MESRGNGQITKGQVDFIYQRGYDVIFLQLRPQYSPNYTTTWVPRCVPDHVKCAGSWHKERNSSQNGRISHQESGFETRYCICDICNIWQTTLDTFDSIFYGLYCCNYDVKVASCAPCAGNFWHFEGRIVTLQLEDLNMKPVSPRIKVHSLKINCLNKLDVSQWFGPIHNMLTLVQIMAWHRSGDKPLSEQMMAKFTDTYVHHSAFVLGNGLVLSDNKALSDPVSS